MTPNEEILQIIRYAPGPIGASAIYEKCKSIESISDVSSRLSQLFNQGKLKREEVITANNRKALAYSIPKPGEAESAAPAAAPSAPAAPAAAATDAAAPAAAAPAATKTRGKAKDKDKVTPKAALQGAGTIHMLPGIDAGRIADAILAKTREQLTRQMSTPRPAQAEAAVPAFEIHVHIEQVDIHLGGL